MQPIWGKTDIVPLYVGDNGSRLSALSSCLRRDKLFKNEIRQKHFPSADFSSTMGGD